MPRLFEKLQTGRSLPDVEVRGRVRGRLLAAGDARVLVEQHLALERGAGGVRVRACGAVDDHVVVRRPVAEADEQVARGRDRVAEVVDVSRRGDVLELEALVGDERRRAGCVVLRLAVLDDFLRGRAGRHRVAAVRRDRRADRRRAEAQRRMRVEMQLVVGVGREAGERDRDLPLERVGRIRERRARVLGCRPPRGRTSPARACGSGGRGAPRRRALRRRRAA